MWARMQGATNRAMASLRLTSRQVAPRGPERNIGDSCFTSGAPSDGDGSGGQLMAVTRMAILQEAARRKMEAERIRRKPRSRMQRAIDKPNSSFNLLMIGIVSLSVLLFMLETEASVVCALGRTGRNVWWWVEVRPTATLPVTLIRTLPLPLTPTPTPTPTVSLTPTRRSASHSSRRRCSPALASSPPSRARAATAAPRAACACCASQ